MPRISTRLAQRMAAVQRRLFETNDRFLGVKSMKWLWGACPSVFTVASLRACAYAHVAKEEEVVAPAQFVLLALRQLSSI